MQMPMKDVISLDVIPVVNGKHGVLFGGGN